MLSEELPNCLCGSRTYNGGGGSVGGRVATTSFKCGVCGRSIWVIEDRKGAVALIDTYSDILAGLSAENYVNNILIPSREAGCSYAPALPDEISAFQRIDKGVWQTIDHKISQSLPIPQDPRKKEYRDFWRVVLKELALNKPVSEVKNEYCDDQNNREPWFKLELDNNNTIVFGPRKRVYSIKINKWIDKPSDTLPFTKLEALSKRDQVTYSNSYNGGYRQMVEIHAYGKEKFVEYFKTAMEEFNV